MANLHLTDTGTVVVLTCRDDDNQVIDISAATTVKMRFQKPDDTAFEKACVLRTDGTDGKFQCIIETGELDITGDWRLQGYLELPGWSGFTSIIEFVVDPIIEVS